MTFDRLLFIDRLKIAGVDEVVARAHAEALRDALADTVATKADMQELERSIKADMQELERSIKADMQVLERKIDTRFGELDRKIEIGLRDVVIKGAGAMVILVSVIIGLKLFG